MSGSGDEADIREVRHTMQMTALEAVIYMCLRDMDSVRHGSDICMARDIADYIIQHLPKDADT
jgi:hypothetical protein